MNAEELRKKSVKELQQECEDLLQERFNLRMQKGMQEVTPKFHRFKQSRREIARIITILNEKRQKHE